MLSVIKRTRSGESFYGYNLNTPSVYKFISHISFRIEYGGPSFLFQQRWNSTESDNVPVVNNQLCQIECDNTERARLYEVLNVNNLLSKKIIMLSSGELRRMTLCKILLQKPRVLIIENPYVGLDIKMRNELSELFKAISESNDTSFIFVASHPRDIPPVTTHIYNVGNFSLSEKKKYSPEENQNDFRRDLFPQTDIDDSAEPVVELSSINIRYGERVLFKDFNWKINKGEKWLLSGANGSGKTTLLSLITADNPLAYSQKISFFGKKRGSGESIWGNSFVNEFTVELSHFKGTFSMANSGSKTNGSQCIIVSNESHDPALVSQMEAAAWPTNIIEGYQNLG